MIKNGRTGLIIKTGIKKMRDISIILSYFSPVGAKLPEQHFARTLELAVESGAEVCVSQVVKENAEPLPTPGAHSSSVFVSADHIFFKENLWNLAAAQATKNKLLFLDADLYYTQPDWLERISAALDQYDVIQPFDMCYWEGFKGNGIDVSLQRMCWFYAVHHNIVPDGRMHHPGFGFAFKRSFFEKVGGFYTYGCLGFGDSLFCAAVTPNTLIRRLLEKVYSVQKNTDDLRGNDKIYWVSAAKHYLADSYLKYRQVLQDTPHKLGYIPGLPIYHRWHGTIKNRNYATRMQFVDWPDDEPPVKYRPDGLLTWSVPQPRAVEWWKNRDDDGLTGGIAPKKFAPK